MMALMAPATRPASRLPWRRALLALAAALLLGAVFAAYHRPGVMLDLATRVWSCF